MSIEDEQQKHWYTDWGAELFLLVTAAFLGFTIQAAATAGTTGSIVWWWIASGVLVIVAAYTRFRDRKLRRRQHKAVASAMDTALDEQSKRMKLLFEALAALSESDGSPNDAKRFRQTLVDTVPGLFGSENARACIYGLAGIESEPEHPNAGRSYTLDFVAAGGRTDPPRAVVVPGKDAWNAMIDAALGAHAVKVDNYRTTNHPLDRHPAARWESFLQIPLLPFDPHRTSYGLLTIDFVAPRKFPPKDVSTCWLVGRIYAVAMLMIEQAGRNTTPERTEALGRVQAMKNTGVADERTQAFIDWANQLKRQIRESK